MTLMNLMTRMGFNDCQYYFSKFPYVYRIRRCNFRDYYFFSRKNMKRQQQYFEKLHEALQIGKRVVCANGLYGTVKKVDEEKVDVEIAKGVVITVSRFAISEVL